MKEIDLSEVAVDMIIVFSGSRGEKSHPMAVVDVSKVAICGWQEAVEILFICLSSNRKHYMVVGVDDFLRSGNQFHLIARP